MVRNGDRGQRGKVGRHPPNQQGLEPRVKENHVQLPLAVSLHAMDLKYKEVKMTVQLIMSMDALSIGYCHLQYQLQIIT